MGILLETGAIAPEEVASALSQVLAGEEFANSKRLRRFLSYLVEQSIAGEFGVKEYNIALAVFDRESSFNPATDTIVRVEARRLRQQLAHYYHGSGRLDPVVIEIPKGGYLPAFRRREPESAVRHYPPRTLAWVAGAALMLAAASLVYGAFTRGWRVPETGVLNGTNLRILDSENRLCWEKHFPSLEGGYDPSILDRVLIADIDGDGRREVLFNLPPLPELRGAVLCYEQNGTLRWQYRYGEPKTFAGRSFDDRYRGRLLRPVVAGGRHLLLTVANHYIWYPSQVALLDPKDARVIDEYWHPGAIYHGVVRDIDGDGAPEFVFAAINNPGQGLGRPAVGELTLPFSRAPRRPAETGGSLPALTGGGELRYALLPIPDVTRAMGVLPAPVHLTLAGDRITVETPLPELGGIVYGLDFTLAVREFRYSDNLPALHQRFFLQKLLDHALSDAEIASLGYAARFDAAPDGNSPELRRFWKW